MVKKIEIKPLSNYEIFNYATNKNLKIYCIPKDQLANHKLLKNKQSIVINLDDSDGSGTHWLALIKKNNQLFYYDPFGVEHIDPEILNFIKKHKNNKAFLSKEQNQNITSVKCGYYCLACINSIIGKADMSFQDYMDVLHDEPSKFNEYIIFTML